jgi:hypothetical protein
MILQYSNWRKLNESEDGKFQHYLTFNFNTNKDSNVNLRILPVSATDASLAAISYFKEAYPSAKITTHGPAGIKFPNENYENLEGEKEDLFLNFEKLVDSSSRWSTSGDPVYLRAMNDLVYPDLVKTKLLKPFTKQIINKSDVDYEIALTDEFANLDESQIKDKLIEGAKKQIETALGVKVDRQDIAESIEALMIQNSLGDAFKDAEEELRLIRTVLAKPALKKITEFIQTIDIKKESIDLTAFGKQIEQRTNKFLIDYSKLSEAEIKELEKPLIDYLFYLNKTLRKRGGRLQEIGIDNIKKILRHLSQYPEVSEIIYSS